MSIRSKVKTQGEISSDSVGPKHQAVEIFDSTSRAGTAGVLTHRQKESTQDEVVPFH